MIIFSRHFPTYKAADVFVIASVNIHEQVYVEVNGNGVCMPAQDALAFAEALTRAAKGQGVLAGPHTPGTSDE